MARGSLTLDHKRSCPLHDLPKPAMFDARKCSCSPRVIGRIHGERYPLGYLAPSWKKAALGEFEDKLADLRDPQRRLRSERSPLLREWYAEWIVGIRAAVNKGQLAEGTRRAYEQRWNRYISKDPLAAKPINSIQPSDLRAFVDRMLAGNVRRDQRPLSHRYANELLTPISAMLTDAEINGLIPSNPARVPRRARHGATQRNAVYLQLERKPAKHLSIEDARALLAVTPEPFRLIVLWPLVTGARRGEIQAASLEDVSWAKRELAIHYQLNVRRERDKVKAGRKREVVLWSGLERLLGQVRAAGNTTWIFTKPGTGVPLRLGGADAILRDAMNAIGVRVDTPDEKQPLWHALRHTYSTYLRSQGVRWEAVEYMMGHKARDTTEKYVHLLDEDRAAVERALTAAYGDLVFSPWGASPLTATAV